MADCFMTSKQVDLLEQLDDFIEWVECFGRISSADVAYMARLVENLACSVKKSEERNALVEKSPFPEGDNQ